MGFFEKPNYITSCRSSIDTIALKCFVSEKIAVFCILATDRQTDSRTDGQHRCTKPLRITVRVTRSTAVTDVMRAVSAAADLSSSSSSNDIV